MLRHLVFTCLVIAASAPGASAQAAPASAPAYDITTVKPHKPGADNGMSWRWHDSTYEGINILLNGMIADAYQVKTWLVFGLPPWAETAHFDIQAKVSDADPEIFKKLTPVQRRGMLAGLLKDRFGLQVHVEMKEQPVFELTVLPEGIKFQPTLPLKPSADGEPPPKQQASWGIGNGKLKATYMDIPTLAENISYRVERTILDKTNLTGHYDLNLRWTPEDQGGKTQDNGTGGDVAPDIFTALKEQLGLKLTAAKAPVPTVVVDKITPPDPN